MGAVGGVRAEGRGGTEAFEGEASGKEPGVLERPVRAALDALGRRNPGAGGVQTERCKPQRINLSESSQECVHKYGKNPRACGLARFTHPSLRERNPKGCRTVAPIPHAGGGRLTRSGRSWRCQGIRKREALGPGGQRSRMLGAARSVSVGSGGRSAGRAPSTDRPIASAAPGRATVSTCHRRGTGSCRRGLQTVQSAHRARAPHGKRRDSREEWILAEESD